jgi:hypothetical protein
MNDSSGDDRTRDPRTLVREALREAGEGPEPDMSRLLAAVPDMITESRRRRLQARPAPLAAIVPLAARVIPRLAAATAVLALLATVTLVLDHGTTTGERSDLDTVLLGGAEASGGVEDLLLGKSVSQGDENG